MEVAFWPPTERIVSQLSPCKSIPSNFALWLTIVFSYHDILESAPDHPSSLHSGRRVEFPAQPSSFDFFPLFNIQYPTTTYAIVNLAIDIPLRLLDVYNGTISDTVSFHPTLDSETWFQPYSAIFNPDGTWLLTGGKNRIHYFDPKGSGKAYPCHALNTYDAELGGMGFRGLISAIDISTQTGILAVGSFTRFIGLYANQGFEDTRCPYTSFSLPKHTDLGFERQGMVGTGITQVMFSPCGRYLYVVERRAEVIWMYDVAGMVSAMPVAWLGPRPCEGSMKMRFDISGDEGGHYVWSGGADGKVRMWEAPYRFKGEVQPTMVVEVGVRPVVSVQVGPKAEFFVTAEGRVDVGKKDSDSEESDEDEGIVHGGVFTPIVKSQGALKLWSRTPTRIETQQAAE